jgi:uncharacterized protein with gpF-like domain
VVDEVWGWRYVSSDDLRTRVDHKALNDKVFGLGYADQFFPPWDFNCRCSGEFIPVWEAENEGLISSQIPQHVHESSIMSDFACPALSDEYTPDLLDYVPEAVRDYLRDSPIGG